MMINLFVEIYVEQLLFVLLHRTDDTVHILLSGANI